MAEAPNLTTSKVRLWDRLQSDYNVGSGDGLVLHPETELSAVIMTTDNYIVSSGNSLKLNIDSVWSGNISARVASEYCPLVKVVSGSTQYADMYVNNGTATVTEVPTSTGYGTLLHALSTITSVRAVSGANSATNDYIPTERAVALALSGKQQLLSGGVCIKLTPGLNYTDVSVNVQSNTPLPSLASATQSRIPTEYVVRHAIDAGVAAGSNYASGLVDNLSTTIDNAGYATSNWCINTFALKGESSGGSSGGSATGDPATYEALGVVKIAGPNSGLAVTLGLPESGAGLLSLSPATTSTLGGVVVGSGLVMSNTSKLNLKPASSAQIGGVKVATGSGLTLDSSTGNLYLSAAPVGDSTGTYATAVTSLGSNAIGGVYVMDHIESATTTAQKASAIVPSVDAVWSAVNAVAYKFSSGVTEAGGTVTLDKATSSAIGGIIVGSGLDVSSGTVSLASADYTSFGGVVVAQNMGIGIGDGVISMTAAAVVDTYSSAFTMVGPGNIGGVVVMDTIESAADEYQASAPIVPTVQAVFAYVSASGGGSGGGGKPISSGGGVTVTDSTTHYVLTLNRAGTTSATYGGVYVPSGSGLGLITATGTSQGKLYLSSATSTALGGVKVPNNSGLSLTNGSLKLSSATTTSIGGVIVPSSSGLTIANGSLGVTSAIFGSDYSDAVAKCSNGYFGGVVLMSAIASGGANNASHAVVPTVDAVYNALQNVDASYNGPFAIVSSTDAGSGAIVCVFNGGLIHTLNGDISVDSRGGTLSSGDTVYLYGSSGLSPEGAEHQTSNDFVIVGDGQSVAAAAGETYVRLATNTGGKLIQYQYGDMGTEFWGDDYWNVFAISRMPLPTNVTSSAANAGYHKNRYILDSGGSIYGCAPFNSAGSNYISSYPLFGNTLTSSQTFTYPTESGYTSSGVHPHDGLYLKHEQTMTQQAQVWLNIWSGTWPSSSGGWLSSTIKMWRYVVDTCCYEQKGESWCSGAYSVQIGNITNNGAPVQLHKGALAVRGRWS